MAAKALFDRADQLVARLEGLAAAPARSREEHAVHDAWRVAIRPRAARMARRARALADPRRWEFDEKGQPDLLRAAAWSFVVRELAALQAEVEGSLRQHERVRVTWSPAARFGIERGANAPVSTTKTKAKDREAAAKAAAKAREARVENAEKVLKDVEKRLAATRKTLAELLEEVRHLTAALQAAEEDRLERRARRLAEGSPAREEAEDLLLEMARGRLQAERHREPGAAAWGSLLRSRWLQPRARLVGLLEGP